MNGLSLQIDSKWAVLSQGDSVNIQNNSPVWDQGNSFSLPFELDIEANRHILGNADQITGQSVYEVLDGKRAVLYTLGIPVYYGKIKMEDQVELSEGKVDVTLVSGNLTFDEMIDGMNCQDVELLDEIVVGERLSEFEVKVSGDNGRDSGKVKSYFPENFMWMEVDGQSTVNVTYPYPQSKYCNIRICYQRPGENSEGEDLDLYEGIKDDIPYFREFEKKLLDKETYGKYLVLDANRGLSGICFYVLYFLDCLFSKKLSFRFSHDEISYMEDMKRLAFCRTTCAYDEQDTGRTVDPRDFLANREDFFVKWNYGYIPNSYSKEISAPLKRCIANSKNFPNADVSEVIDALKSGFGIRFLFNKEFSECRCVYIKDILRDVEVRAINSAEIYSVEKSENSTKGFALTYSSGDESDVSYNYADWGKNVELSNSYNYITSQTDAYNKTCYIDTRSGNAYRVKVDEEAKSEEELNAALFEVGTFNDATYGDCSNEDQVEAVEIGFVPVVMNDVLYKKRRTVLRSSAQRYQSRSFTPDSSDGESAVGGGTSSGGGSFAGATSDNTTNDQLFALFLDVSMKHPSWMPYIKIAFATSRLSAVEFLYTYYNVQRYDESITDQSKKALNKYREEHEKENVYKKKAYISAMKFENNSPIQTFDTGLMFGVMRGPGNEAGFEDFNENYDGEGNYRYVMTSKGYAFHSDTVDNYARAWDYNGTMEGGVETEGSISLKLRAEKPNPEGGFYPITETYAQRRGLFDKFYSEYAYFVVNRKIVRMKCRMEMADLLNIDWTKRYKIGEYVGFINKYSYSVSSTGISDVELEMYYI